MVRWLNQVVTRQYSCFRVDVEFKGRPSSLKQDSCRRRSSYLSDNMIVALKVLACICMVKLALPSVNVQALGRIQCTCMPCQRLLTNILKLFYVFKTGTDGPRSAAWPQTDCCQDHCTALKKLPHSIYFSSKGDHSICKVAKDYMHPESWTEPDLCVQPATKQQLLPLTDSIVSLTQTNARLQE